MQAISYLGSKGGSKGTFFLLPFVFAISNGQAQENVNNLACSCQILADIISV
jgi:hypothetical protein